LDSAMNRASYQRPVYFAGPLRDGEESELTQIHSSLLEQVLQKSPWSSISSPAAVLRGNKLVLELQRGHEVVRCETGDHVIKEYDVVGLTGLYRVADKVVPVSIDMQNQPGVIINPFPNIALLSVGEMKNHYQQAHSSRKDPLWEKFTLDNLERSRRMGTAFPD